MNDLRPSPMTVEEAKQILEMEVDWDWEKFRREAAKDFIAANMVQNGQDFYNPRCHPDIVERAINLSDELIKQLKESEK